MYNVEIVISVVSTLILFNETGFPGDVGAPGDDMTGDSPILRSYEAFIHSYDWQLQRLNPRLERINKYARKLRDSFEGKLHARTSSIAAFCTTANTVLASVYYVITTVKLCRKHELTFNCVMLLQNSVVMLQGEKKATLETRGLQAKTRLEKKV